MKKRNVGRKRNIYWLGISLVLLTACASEPKVVVDAIEVQQQFKGQTVAQALKETEATMARAEQDELAFYSPGFFAVAQKALDEARFLILEPKEATLKTSSDTQIFSKLLLADKSLAQAVATKPEVQQRLGEILKVRDSLVTKGIDQSAADEYNDVLNELSDLFRRIERKELDGFERISSITLHQFQRLESQSVKTAKLDQVITVLEQAEAMGARGAAPKSYQKTRQALENAQAVIERDPNDQRAIENAVKHFAFEANHLVHITQAVKELRALNDTAMENILLAAESRLLAIADALGQPDPRQKNLRKQTETLANAAARLVADKTGQSTKLRTRPVNKNELEEAYLHNAQLQAQLRGMQTKNAQLKRDEKPLKRRINELKRVVLQLNNEKTVLEEELAKMTAPPAGGVEIIPIK
ncbi:MAG: hypothetical protein L3K25_00100 [Gammaproteobacteria bacterium]|nr:hypothetical protein [Gammaproteobacteria bacterium]